MTTDLLPNISLPYVIVMTTYVGASPETVEMVVTKPVESSMATVSNIESISSVSSENYSMVILEFAQSADMNAVSLEIRENLDQIKSYWDDSVGHIGQTDIRQQIRGHTGKRHYPQHNGQHHANQHGIWFFYTEF